MPNHVRTVIKISKIKPDDISLILNLLATKEKGQIIIDFDKIKPEPRTINNCPEDYRITSAKEAYIEENDERPWFNWYTWRISHWGTKWEAYDGYTVIGKTYIKFIFSTAWSLADPIIQKLASLGYDIDVKYADEAYGSNCGKLTYTSEQGWAYWNEFELKDPVRFARDLWNRY